MYRRCRVGLAAVLPLVLVACAHARSKGMFKDCPDDFSVAAHNSARKQVKAAVEKEAKNRKSFQDEAKQINALAVPWKAGGNVSIRVKETGRGPYRLKTGPLGRVTSRTVSLGIHDYALAYVHEYDRLRLKYAGKSELLAKYIAERRADLESRKQAWIRNEIATRLEAEGYTAQFQKNTVVLGGRYWFRKDLGDGGSVKMELVEYRDGCQQMSRFVRIRLLHSSGEGFSCVLHVGGRPVAAIGSVDHDVKWDKASFRLPRSVVLGNDEVSGKEIILTCTKNHIGHWGLKGKCLSSREGRIHSVLCPLCWGAKESVSPPPGRVAGGQPTKQETPAADISSRPITCRQPGIRKLVAPLLECPWLTPNSIGKINRLVKECGAGSEGRAGQLCTYCNGAGTIRLDRPGKASRHLFVFRLDDTSLTNFNQAAAKKQVEAARVIAGHNKVAAAIEKEFAGAIAESRLKKQTAAIRQKIADIVAADKAAYERKAYEQVEALDWKEPVDLADGPVAMNDVDLKDSGRRGHKPQTLFGQPVRRMTEWRKIHSFVSQGGLAAHDYNVAAAYYRFVEIGGTPRTTRVVSTLGKADESRTVPKMNEPDDKPLGPVPADLLVRKYVVQYAINIDTGSKHEDFVFDVTFDARPTSNAVSLFKLDDNEKVITFKNRHVLKKRWTGHAIGARLISLNQVIADYAGEKALRFHVVVGLKP